MKKRISSLLLAICLLIPLLANAEPTESSVYRTIIAMKDDYPEGMPWTNADFYAWNGGVFYGGYGCVAFAFILSDAAFGNLHAREVYLKDFEGLKVGDILRIYNDQHSVIILEVKENEIVIAEGNYNSSIHWGRIMSRNQVLNTTNYVLTRYTGSESLEAPTNLKATADEAGRVTLKWKKNAFAEVYTVYRDGKAVADVKGTKYTDTDTKAGKQYQYCVSARTRYNASVITSPKSAKVTVNVPIFWSDTTGKYEIINNHAAFASPADINAANLTIPDTVTVDGNVCRVTEIAARACEGIQNLKTLTIGKHVKAIGAAAFKDCGKLKKITVLSSGLTEKTIGKDCFRNISKKAKVKCPKKVLNDYSAWFTAIGGMPAGAAFVK